MDPNETLRLLRSQCNDPGIDFDEYDVRAAFTALDDWLSKGGFLPHDWQTRALTNYNNDRPEGY